MINKVKSGTFLIMTYTFDELEYLKQKVREYGLDILVTYKLLPMMVVRGASLTIIELAKEYKCYIRGIYYNRMFHLPKIWSNNNEVSTTTRESATAIGAATVWDEGYNGTGVRIAIIDTGIDSNHPDLKFPNGTSKVVAAKSFVLTIYGYDVNDTNPGDPQGHGTAVAGVAAGSGAGDPQRGVGVAPGALLMAARVFPAQGGATVASIVAAIEWAVYGPDGELGTGDEADVINMSLGGGTWYIEPTYYAIKRATELGVIVVVAAGNDGEDGLYSTSVGAPGDVDFAITVGASDVQGTFLKDYSSFGPTIRYSIKPDIVAPAGVDVIWTKGSYLRGVEGTSISSPHVAGAVALLVQYLRSEGINNVTRVGAIKSALLKTAAVISGFGELARGAGFVRVDKAFSLLRDQIAAGNIKISYIAPKKLPTGYKLGEPFFPYGHKIFRGMKIEFNATIVTSYDTTIQVEFDSELLGVFDIDSNTLFSVNAGTNLWEFRGMVKNDANLDSVTGKITFKDKENNVIGEITLNFEVAEPRAFAAFDLKHTSWAPIDSKYGQYRYLFLAFEEVNVAVEEIGFFGKFDEDTLSRYDIIFSPDTATYYEVYNPENGSVIGKALAGYTSEEIEALLEWVNNSGIWIVIAMIPGYNISMNDPENINSIVRNFGFEFLNFTVYRGDPVPINVRTDTIITKNVPKIPFYGTGINVLTKEPIILASYSDPDTKETYPVMVATFVPGAQGTGLVLGIGTNFLFDNWAFNNEYSGISGTYLRNLVKNIVNFAVIRREVSLNAPSVVSGRPYVFQMKSIFPIDSIILSDPIGESNLWFRKVDATDYIIKYAPRAVGVNYITITMYNESDTDVYYLTAVKKIMVEEKYNDQSPPVISILRKPSFVTEFQEIELIINVTDDSWVASISVMFTMGAAWKDAEVEYLVDQGVYKVTIPAPGFGTMNIGVKITAEDGFGNVGETTVNISVTPVTGLSIAGVLIAALVIGFLIKKRRS